jgi:uncharacterized membrane protein
VQAAATLVCNGFFIFGATIATMRKHLSETTAHQRLIYAIAVGVAMAMLPLPVTQQTQGLLVWCLGGLVYLGLSWWLAVEFDATRTRHRAQAQDQPGFVLFLLLVLSSFANIVAIALMLQHVRDFSTLQRLGHLALSMAALGISWLLIQTVFAFRYAHVYYQEELRSKVHGAGLVFPGNLAPDYFDFLYYAHVVGMTSQVSDVVVTTRRMRRLTLIHSVTSFAFNMLVLALSINLVAGAMQ